jgi:hypothetical protein
MNTKICSPPTRRNAPSRWPLAFLLSLTLGLSLTWSLPPYALAAQEAECQNACQAGRAKLAAEKAKNQRRQASQAPLREAGQAALRECLATIYSQAKPLLGFPNLPDLTRVLGEICRAGQNELTGALARSWLNQDLALPGLSLEEIFK